MFCGITYLSCHKCYEGLYSRRRRSPTAPKVKSSQYVFLCVQYLLPQLKILCSSVSIKMCWKGHLDINLSQVTAIWYLQTLHTKLQRGDLRHDPNTIVIIWIPFPALLSFLFSHIPSHKHFTPARTMTVREPALVGIVTPHDLPPNLCCVVLWIWQ